MDTPTGDTQEISFEAREYPPAIQLRAQGSSPFVIVCDHASNRLPPSYAGLGLSQIAQQTHIAWDPGALALSLGLSRRLDATLIYATYSRLLIDPNRPLGADDLIPTKSEGIDIPGNQNLAQTERARRIKAFHRPYHTMIDAELGRRAALAQPSVIIAIHSFTPTYLGAVRPWPIGLLPAKDTGFSQDLFDALSSDDPALNVGWNEPYAAADGVYCTLEQHADSPQHPATLVELRNNELTTNAHVNDWADRLARCLRTAYQPD